jgi:23S rRNA (cytosine1962-C5)-methyltransferase
VKPVHLVLAKDLSRSLRAGHPWLFSAAFERLPDATPGSMALVKTRTGDIVAKGMYDPTSAIPFRYLTF